MMPVQELDELCANLGVAMHAVAQPLTILRTRLDPIFTEQLDVQGLRQLTADAVVEVQRLCRLFEYVQDFVTMESEAARVSPIEVEPLLTHVVEGVELFFRDAGMHLVVHAEGSFGYVLLDPQRAAQALTNVLLVAQSAAKIGDRITLVVCSRGDCVRVEVYNLACSAPLSAEPRLRLALACAGMRSQQGECWWSAEPLRVAMLWRGAPSRV